MKRKIRWYRAPFYVGLFLLAVVIIVRALLPFWVRDYVNSKLSEIPEYRGHVAAVTLHLWRGAYQIHNVEIVKTSGHVPAPFFPRRLSIFQCNGGPSSTARSLAISISFGQR